jgi:hypothetical protein
MDTHANAAFIIKGVKLLADQDQGDTPPLEVLRRRSTPATAQR